ncbi:hypothetical protein BCV73_32915 [Paenibacillus sp. SSG-1]|uniref:hypothetical protein n=1 Tax=Paenibacillus sp. SSG-1 TaxID=1443669 RepID=UPI000B7D92E3|nr:hypothetical protein [Paenibacillus sp. SSG-1]OXL87335.1 hypothetical protein BCV73_32915 [Paenibacillus sp. SSG-1]
MSTKLQTGVNLPDGSDTNNRAAYNENLLFMDIWIRPYRISLQNWDADAQVYTKVLYVKPEDNATAIDCTLTNKTNGRYTTDTWVLQNQPDGMTRKIVWTLTYDSNGNVIDRTYTNQ